MISESSHSAPATAYATRLDRMTIRFNSGSDRFKSRYFFFYLNAIRPCLVRRRFHTRRKTRSRRVTTDYIDVCRCRDIRAVVSVEDCGLRMSFEQILKRR